MENMSYKTHRFIQLALIEADKSTGNHRIGAVLVRGGKVVSKGHNDYGTGSHAEEACLAPVWKSERKDCVLFVARKRRDQEAGLSKPCPHCSELIQKSKIKKVVFTTNDNNVGIIKV